MNMSVEHKEKQGILDRLQVGEVIIGDGGFVWALEKRGYVRPGVWTPECTVEHPEAVLQLHREFARAGSDVMQTFTFPGTQSKMELEDGRLVSEEEVNQSACNIAHEAANEGNLLVCGGMSMSFKYEPGCDKESILLYFREQVEMFKKNNVDFLLGEYFCECEEAEWCVEEMKKAGLPVGLTMCIGPQGDNAGVSPQECAVRLAKAGAVIIGVNCRFDPWTLIKTTRMMKEGLEQAGLLSQVFLMIQPIGYMAPELEHAPNGYIDLPDWPLAMDSRTLTRFEVHKFAREAYNLGVRYIGGCCGFEPYHIRAIAEELATERGRLPVASKKYGAWGADMKNHRIPWAAKRSTRDYWENHRPSSGRPYSSCLCVLDGPSEKKHPKEV